MARKSRGHIEFDESAPDEYIDLVKQTLEESDFIETKWADSVPYRDDDELVIYEVTDE